MTTRAVLWPEVVAIARSMLAREPHNGAVEAELLALGVIAMDDELRRATGLSPPSVHALHHGSALCRFSTEVPGKWPTGHQWVRISEPDRITCDQCRSVLSIAAQLSRA